MFSNAWTNLPPANQQFLIINTSSLKISSNRFSPLIFVLPQYAPLTYIDIEVSYPGKEDPIDTQVLLDYDDQDSFINEQFSKTNLIPYVPKSIPIVLVLADG